MINVMCNGMQSVLTKRFWTTAFSHNQNIYLCLLPLGVHTVYILSHFRDMYNIMPLCSPLHWRCLLTRSVRRATSSIFIKLSIFLSAKRPKIIRLIYLFFSCRLRLKKKYINTFLSCHFIDINSMLYKIIGRKHIYNNRRLLHLILCNCQFFDLHKKIGCNSETWTYCQASRILCHDA